MFRLAIEYIIFTLVKARRKGFGIHSPFMYEFAVNVAAKKGVCDAQLVSWYREMTGRRDPVEGNSTGAGSKTGLQGKNHAGKIIRKSSVSLKFACFLHRMVRWYRPAEILELGGGMGISTLFMAGGHPGAVIHSVEAEPERVQFSRQEAKKLGMLKVEYHQAYFDSFLDEYAPRDHPFMVFIDGDHKGDAMLRYFHKLRKHIRPDSIIILDDIRWSRETYRAWKEISKDTSVRASVDLFFYGILFFREGFIKQDFNMQF